MDNNDMDKKEIKKEEVEDKSNVEEILDELEEKDVKKHGEYSAYLEKANYLLDKYRSAMFFIFFQILIILLLTYGYLATKSNTTVEVLLPKIVKDSDYGKLKIGLNESNELYYKVFGYYIVQYLYNANPTDIKDKIITLKSLIYPSKLPQYENSIDAFEKNIINNSITMKYVETESNVSMKDGIANYYSAGVLTEKVGEYSSTKKFCKTNIEMFTKQYMLFVNSISKECKSLDSGKKHEQ